MSVCYELPDQGQEVDETFFRQLEEASHSQALVLMRDLNHLLSVEGNTGGHEQYRRFPECIDDNFVIQVIKELIRGVLLGLVLI